MITVNLQGGIGNTLFQYAFARTFPSSQLFNNCTQYGYHLGRFNIVLPLTTRPEGRWISERSLRYDSNPEVEETCVLNGYWQCENYFKHIESNLRSELTLREKPSQEAQKVLEQMGGESVMLHIRRGDYLTWAAQRHGVLPVEYYNRAAEQFVNPKFFVFSDDPYFTVPFPHTRVKCVPHEDLWLMSKCKHAIIANSSFSWWGAWLGADRTGKVIAPQQWFRTGNEDSRDIVPERWLRI